jgi:hypothetical protein
VYKAACDAFDVLYNDPNQQYTVGWTAADCENFSGAGPYSGLPATGTGSPFMSLYDFIRQYSYYSAGSLGESILNWPFATVGPIIYPLWYPQDVYLFDAILQYIEKSKGRSMGLKQLTPSVSIPYTGVGNWSAISNPSDSDPTTSGSWIAS